MTTTLTLPLANASQTDTLGARLAPLLAQGGRIYLHGTLGAGKTSLVRAVLRALGVTGRIKSPTYALVEPYKLSNLYCYHFDFYRFADSDEWLESGFDEWLDNPSVLCLVEWPEKAGRSLPEPDLHIRLETDGEGRQAWLEAPTSRGRSWLSALTATPGQVPTQPAAG
jgi:tRNA threonylcarbamoyladenosine biosynthesis protein TsaE